MTRPSQLSTSRTNQSRWQRPQEEVVKVTEAGPDPAEAAPAAEEKIKKEIEVEVKVRVAKGVAPDTPQTRQSPAVIAIIPTVTKLFTVSNHSAVHGCPRSSIENEGSTSLEKRK